MVIGGDFIMKLIPVSQGKKCTKYKHLNLFAIVDDEDFDRINKHIWFAHTDNHHNTFYAITNIWIEGKRRQAKMHRLIMGVIDPTIEIDHIKGNGLDNRKEMLRKCSHIQNCWNYKKKKNGTSKYLGVSFYKKNGKWKAQINENGIRKGLGYFDTEIDASEAFNKEAIRIRQDFFKISNMCESGLGKQ